MIIGVTGVPGSGKSEAIKVFVDLGFLNMSSDKLAQQVLSTDPDVQHAIRKRWGDNLFDDNGQLNWEEYRTCLLDDLKALDWVEALVHPKVYVLREKELAKFPNKDWVLEIPLLFEKKLEKVCDFTVCISVSAAVQHDRLQSRSIDKRLLNALMKRQWPISQKEQAADFVIYNNGSKDFLRQQIERLVLSLRLA